MQIAKITAKISAKTTVKATSNKLQLNKFSGTRNTKVT